MNNPTGMLINPSKQASETRTTIPHPGLVAIALAAIVFFNVLASLYWVAQNTVLIGNDASGYLGTTLEYAQRFTDLSPATLFQAFTYPEYRTPGLFMAVQPFYWLFGIDMVSAQPVNIVALVGLVVTVYALGANAAGSGVGVGWRWDNNRVCRWWCRPSTRNMACATCSNNCRRCWRRCRCQRRLS